MFTTSESGQVHIPGAFIVDRFVCHDCGAFDDCVEDSTRGEIICRSCGAINAERMCIDTLSVSQQQIIEKTYKRLHHFSGKLFIYELDYATIQNHCSFYILLIDYKENSKLHNFRRYIQQNYPFYQFH